MKQTPYVFIDLFSGLGGASEAALQAGWHVLRYDNNRDLLLGVHNTTFGSVMKPTFIFNLAKRLEEYAESIGVSMRDLQVFLWGSPPCTEFSEGYNAPRMVAKREGRDFTPDTSLVERFLEIRDSISPKWWCLENVRGSWKYIAPMVHKVDQPLVSYQKIGPFCLWHNFAPIQVPLGWKPEKKTDLWPGPLRANLRAKVPMEISQGVLNAIYQPTLEDF